MYSQSALLTWDAPTLRAQHLPGPIVLSTKTAHPGYTARTKLRCVRAMIAAFDWTESFAQGRLVRRTLTVHRYSSHTLEPHPQPLPLSLAQSPPGDRGTADKES